MNLISIVITNSVYACIQSDGSQVNLLDDKYVLSGLPLFKVNEKMCSVYKAPKLAYMSSVDDGSRNQYTNLQ